MEPAQIVGLLSVLAQVIFLEGVLSLDNAAVLGAIVLRLPSDQPVPWPHVLTAPGRLLQPLLGNQRTAALRVGLFGAYLGRGLMLLLASFVIRNPWLQLVGALYLLKISVAELGHLGEEGEETLEERKANLHSFWAIVLTVELMDLAFSLDNVVVVISLSDKIWLVLAGVAIGILTMRFAAGIFASLIEKIPALGPAAYVLVFIIGAEFILKRLGVDISEGLRFGMNIGVLVGAAAYSKWAWLRKALALPFKVFHAGFQALDWLIQYALKPFGWAYHKLANYFSLSQQKMSSPQSGSD